MDQNQAQPDEHELYMRQVYTTIERLKNAVQTRRQQDAKILAAVVRGLTEPRGLMREDAEALKSWIRDIVKAELGVCNE
jgi:hypothetical protein